MRTFRSEASEKALKGRLLLHGASVFLHHFPPFYELRLSTASDQKDLKMRCREVAEAASWLKAISDEINRANEDVFTLHDEAKLRTLEPFYRDRICAFVRAITFLSSGKDKE